jgi:hypothetical protein
MNRQYTSCKENTKIGYWKEKWAIQKLKLYVESRTIAVIKERNIHKLNAPIHRVALTYESRVLTFQRQLVNKAGEAWRSPYHPLV